LAPAGRIPPAPVQTSRVSTIEGGADVDQVFNFAWLNAAVASLAVRF
jgi:hypothetical protein